MKVPRVRGGCSGHWPSRGVSPRQERCPLPDTHAIEIVILWLVSFSTSRGFEMICSTVCFGRHVLSPKRSQFPPTLTPGATHGVDQFSGGRTASGDDGTRTHDPLLANNPSQDVWDTWGRV